MANFLPVRDDLSGAIAEKAKLLYELLLQVRVDELGLPYHCLAYFKGSHYKRLYFSIETSAHLLYRAIVAVNKPVKEITLMDYGAGVGTMYSLAKMIGCKKVIYNDHLHDWKQSAELIGRAMAVQVDEYIVGDIDDTLAALRQKDICCDIITTRNVIEHIYKLDHFYSETAAHQPAAWIYSSTTANYKNPASRIKHWLWHRKWEKQFLPQRANIIASLVPQLTPSEVDRLARLTRGKAGEDISTSVSSYVHNKAYPVLGNIGSNTCDPESGVWFEHMISFGEYRKFIENGHYRASFYPGFWDTHYRNKLMNGTGRVLNTIINCSNSIGLRIAPFIYVVAEPTNRKVVSL